MYNKHNGYAMQAREVSTVLLGRGPIVSGLALQAGFGVIDPTGLLDDLRGWPLINAFARGGLLAPNPDDPQASLPAPPRPDPAPSRRPPSPRRRQTWRPAAPCRPVNTLRTST
jgi:hypothetical protein